MFCETVKNDLQSILAITEDFKTTSLPHELALLRFSCWMDWDLKSMLQEIITAAMNFRIMEI